MIEELKSAVDPLPGLDEVTAMDPQDLFNAEFELRTLAQQLENAPLHAPRLSRSPSDRGTPPEARSSVNKMLKALLPLLKYGERFKQSVYELFMALAMFDQAKDRENIANLKNYLEVANRIIVTMKK